MKKWQIILLAIGIVLLVILCSITPNANKISTSLFPAPTATPTTIPTPTDDEIKLRIAMDNETKELEIEAERRIDKMDKKMMKEEERKLNKEMWGSEDGLDADFKKFEKVIEDGKIKAVWVYRDKIFVCMYGSGKIVHIPYIGGPVTFHSPDAPEKTINREGEAMKKKMEDYLKKNNLWVEPVTKTVKTGAR